MNLSTAFHRSGVPGVVAYRALRLDRKCVGAAILFAMLVSGCAGDGGSAPDLALGDLPALIERGQIRILSPHPASVGGLPRQPNYVSMEQGLADAFVRLQGLDPVWVWVDEHDDLIPWLLEGRGDIIAANLTITPARQDQIAYDAGDGSVVGQ